MRERDGNVPARQSDGPCVLLCAVSVGEVNATRALVDQLRATEDAPSVVIAATTQTGRARAAELYGTDPAAPVYAAAYPVDLKRAVHAFYNAVRPSVVVLMELEVWPNFVAEGKCRGMPVLVANGRITEKSFRAYRKARLLLRSSFAALDRVLVQEQVYADRFRQLGVSADRIEVAGSMKSTPRAAMSTKSASRRSRVTSDLPARRGRSWFAVLPGRARRRCCSTFTRRCWQSTTVRASSWCRASRSGLTRSRN
ncbi:MAG: glycosyltransferase N-terminal domain-containing protein, partial [Planctomycetota bacterium]